MLHHTRSLALKPLTALFSLASFGLISCGDGSDQSTNPDAVQEGPSGSITLSLSASESIAGFLIEVKESSGALVSSEFTSVGSGGGTVQKFLSLAPGSYKVSSTPMRSPGEPEPACKVASRGVVVKSGKTSEVSLLSKCQSGGLGGLGIEAGANFVPALTSVEVDPGTHVAACQTVMIAFAASDADGDLLSCDASLDSGEPFATEAMPGAEPGSVECTVRVAPAGGEHHLLLRACDELDCASFDLPLHVAAGSCTPDCDDGNPCTEDQRNAAGFCTSSPIADGSLCAGGNLKVKVLGFNDFHGQLEKGRVVAGRPVGGAAVLAAYLNAAQAGIEDQTIIVHAGDHVGASPPASALLQDEPSIQFLNMLANDACTVDDRLNPACNLVATVGNHEFDEGMLELLRLLSGGNFATGPFLEDPYPGARFPYVSANVIERATGETLLRPFVVKELHGLKLGFIGAVLEQTPSIVTPTGVAGLDFLDEADAINTQVAALKALGVRAQVVTIHQGGFQSSYSGPTRLASMPSSGEILDIVSRLDDEIDVVISGHTHAFTNALIPNANGKPILVVQAFSAGTAYDDVDLQIDPLSGDVVAKTAQVVTTFSDVAPGLTPDAAIAAMVQEASDRVAPLVNQVFGVATSALNRNQNAAGESQMGDLIADAQLAAQSSQFVFMNPGGIRADLDAGEITFGDLFTIQPFGNTLVQMSMTGAQIIAVLEQQWQLASPRVLQIAGFSYTWNPAAAPGSRIVEIRLGGGGLIDPAATYTVTCNNFLATGGDGFTTFLAGTNQVGGPVDLDALIEYVTHAATISVPAGGRIQTL